MVLGRRLIKRAPALVRRPPRFVARGREHYSTTLHGDNAPKSNAAAAYITRAFVAAKPHAPPGQSISGPYNNNHPVATNPGRRSDGRAFSEFTRALSVLPAIRPPPPLGTLSVSVGTCVGREKPRNLFFFSLQPRETRRRIEVPRGTCRQISSAGVFCRAFGVFGGENQNVLSRAFTSMSKARSKNHRLFVEIVTKITTMRDDPRRMKKQTY